jgi:hypothetical protein
MFDIVRQNPAAEHRRSKAGSSATSRAAVRRVRPSFEAMKAAAKRKDFQPVPLKATLDATIDAKTERRSPRTMSSASCPARNIPTRR